MTKEIPENEVIEFVGLKDLLPEQQAIVHQITTKNYEKIKRDLKNITSLVVHIKTYSKEGERQKYSLHVRCICPSKIIESCQSHDFELERALHKALDNIREQIKHKYHSDVTSPKTY